MERGEMEEKKGIEFPAFPFNPYSIQLDFMKFLYQSLERGGISMLESPTGTGKTLSIICSALQWLVDRKKLGSFECNENDELDEQSVADNDDEPDWMRNFVPIKESSTPERNSFMPKWKNRIRQREMLMKKDKEVLFSSLKEDEVLGMNGEVKNAVVKGQVTEVDDGEFLLEEYESGEEDVRELKRKNGKIEVLSSGDEEEIDEFNDEAEETRLKIYFCSRTHSQLSQFISELKKTTFANDLNVVCLGSRKNLCLNNDVLKLGNSTRINERCLELQKSKNGECSKIKKLGVERKVCRKKVSRGCPMLSNRKTEEFKKAIIQLKPLDIEDLVHIGHELGSCPYYGSRRMMPTADLIVLPYQSLLSKSSRESLGLSLKNSVVIIDEAHNLADTLISMHDAKITLNQLTCLQFLLDQYFKRFCNLLGSRNRRYIQTLMVLMRALSQILCDDRKVVNPANNLQDDEEIIGSFNYSMTINEFLFALNIDNINLVKLLQYIKESNIFYKVSGYGDKVSVTQKTAMDTVAEPSNDESSTSGFRSLAEILFSLTNKDSDGKIIISRRQPACSGHERGYIKYVMLTGEKIFSQVVDQAHAVILAGGTLQPIEETKERLFPSLSSNQLQFFSCGHIIPSKNILPVAVKHGPSGQLLDFSFKSRASQTMIKELGLLVSNLVTVVPGGVVVFFSSFEYEGRVYEAWKASGILSRIMKKKCIFREPKKNTDVEVILREYKETIHALSISDPKSCNGAVLLAVVGGKISEGINLSDGSGRCIIMVGLPYPNPSDIELIERVKQIEGYERTAPSKNMKLFVQDKQVNGNVSSEFQILRSCKGRGKDYYENLCMKAVNQSIGRAIRHINDYATILLVDGRYTTDSSRSSFSHMTDKLPQWIKCQLVTTSSYGEVHQLVHKFFQFHKTEETRLPESSTVRVDAS